MRRVRQSTVEPVFGNRIHHYGLRRMNVRGRAGAHKTMLLTAVAYNLKKLLKYRPERQVSLALPRPPTGRENTRLPTKQAHRSAHPGIAMGPLSNKTTLPRSSATATVVVVAELLAAAPSGCSISLPTLKRRSDGLFTHASSLVYLVSERASEFCNSHGGSLTPWPLPIGRAASGEGSRLGRGDLRGPPQCFGAENRVIFAAFIGFRRRFHEEGKILPVLSRFS